MRDQDAGYWGQIIAAFLLVGYDLIPYNQQFFLQGHINAIISQCPEEQGQEALLTLFRSVVLVQTVEKRVEIPLDLYFLGKYSLKEIKFYYIFIRFLLDFN